MEIVRTFLLYFHLMGFAVMVGGVILQVRMKRPEIMSYMLGAAIGQLVTGVGLVWARMQLDLPVINAKMGVKLVLDIVVAVAAIIGARQTPKQAWPFYTVALAGGVAATVAIFWR